MHSILTHRCLIPHSEVLRGRMGLGLRLRESLGEAAEGMGRRSLAERGVLSQGRAFSGEVRIPPLVSGKEKEERARTAMEEAKSV